jgi:Putative DNA-binding domain
MIFIDRPITARQVHDVCSRFNEGVRVEYKGTFDRSVRDQLPKIVSSFANSQGGVLIVGVRAVNGVAQEPFEGFEVGPREEFPLTVENICLSGIHPAVLPRIEVVRSEVPNRAFLILEVEESGEAPHAIENSRKVYVRTGNAANPYDLAEVDHIIDLMKRRSEPEGRLVRLIASAEDRSHQCIQPNRPLSQISIHPTFPRKPLCTSQQAWEVLLANRNLLNNNYENSLIRIPDGAASLQGRTANPNVSPQYEELNAYGLLFASRQLRFTNWYGQDVREQLAFMDLFQPLLRMTLLAGRFYPAHAYNGNLIVNVSLKNVEGQAMRFVRAENILDVQAPDDFRCYANVVSAQRLVSFEYLNNQRLDFLTDILSQLTWAFWQSLQDSPAARLRHFIQTLIHELGVA